MIVDSHQHFWQVGRFDYPWMSSSVEVLYRDYLPDQLKPLLEENNVSKTVLVQASNSLAESRWLLSLADEHPFIAGVVGWVDLMDVDVDRQIEELSNNHKFKGVRHLVESEPEEHWLIQPEVLRGLQRLSNYDLTYDLLVHPRHLKYVPQVADACPDLRLVVDHMAKPPIVSGALTEWATALKPVAANPIIYCKLSGLVTEASWSSCQLSDLRPYVECALEMFGADRMMFGSDHPVCLLASSYGRVLESFQEILGALSASDREKILSTNATNFYRLN